MLENLSDPSTTEAASLRGWVWQMGYKARRPRGYAGLSNYYFGTSSGTFKKICEYFCFDQLATMGEQFWDLFASFVTHLSDAFA